MTRLIINADDFGLTTGVNRAIVELHRAGLLTSATMMAKASATDDAIEQARSSSSLGIGCHIVLVDGEPVLSPRLDIPNLADPVDGTFRQTLLQFLNLIYLQCTWPFQKPAVSEIEAEAAAQILLLQQRGLHLTHIDTHKHTHMFPRVLRPVLRAARAAGIRAVRNPFEPEWAVHATPRASWMRSAEVWALRRFGPYFRRIIAEEGFVTTDGTIAIAGTGTVDAASLRALLAHVPEGTWELVTHPGYNDADLARIHTRLRESRDIERLALQVVKEFPAIQLISFADLPAATAR
ncbi:MAG TPA: ChbG/HpnK family deacetylase [Terracidiphilus sp.]|nr:ChbG/HpnK family deacetylase [Terracidiphilus sp.]